MKTYQVKFKDMKGNILTFTSEITEEIAATRIVIDSVLKAHSIPKENIIYAKFI